VRRKRASRGKEKILTSFLFDFSCSILSSLSLSVLSYSEGGPFLFAEMLHVREQVLLLLRQKLCPRFLEPNLFLFQA
jgi:hypothetical protein